mmetsp:Transcript_27260/g.41017  ORF Transcript_27260/g.41017 Transcript_27260/m.41017 type:complete len:326 (-) Transcript_27260:18-995(-)
MKPSEYAFVSPWSSPSLHGSPRLSQQLHSMNNGLDDFDFATDTVKEPLFPDVSSWLIGSSAELEPSVTFEPQVNTPALFSFAIIAVVFSLLQIRINSVRDASTRREEALSFLRQVKSEQLDLSFQSRSTGSNEQAMAKEQADNNNDKVKDAIKAYEIALKEELDLRTIVPGVRIVAPNDASRREQDIAAAKQFLDWDIDILDGNENNDDSNSDKMKSNRGVGGGAFSLNNLENDGDKKELQQSERKKQLMQSRRRFDGEEGNAPSSSKTENEPMSNAAKAILLTVALSQIALLFLLSLDPMSANNVFPEIAGNPPESIPLSSWIK